MAFILLFILWSAVSVAALRAGTRLALGLWGFALACTLALFVMHMSTPLELSF
jgi:Family of unknown function (DUF5993)